MLTVAITQNYVNGSLALNLTYMCTYTINSYYICYEITKSIACFNYSTCSYCYVFDFYISKQNDSIQLSVYLCIQTKFMVMGPLKQHSLGNDFT